MARPRFARASAVWALRSLTVSLLCAASASVHASQYSPPGADVTGHIGAGGRGGPGHRLGFARGNIWTLGSASLAVGRPHQGAGPVCQRRPWLRGAGPTRRAQRGGAAGVLGCASSSSAEPDVKVGAASARRGVPFTLRRARPHELDLLAVLSTEAFTPRGAWWELVQRVKFTLIAWDLQAQLYSRFYHWKDCIKEFKPPITESRYALLVGAKSNGNAIGVTELCVAPNPAPPEEVESWGLAENAPYLSNLAVDKRFRRNGVGKALVEMCEDLSVEWGHNVIFLHVEETNDVAIDFYRRLGFLEATRDMGWYDRIGRQDLQQQDQVLMYKMLDEKLARQTHLGTMQVDEE